MLLFLKYGQKGGEGGIAVAKEVLRLLDEKK
uniref:Uncharacterized protein n=1 Tax=Clostridioides difficile TaxID=1496 RepID=A0A381I5S3_CLODI|nr:Uncharacterised protein [Clostridioides difficile]